MGTNEVQHKPKIAASQTSLNRIIVAAAHVSQARLLVLQERRETMGHGKVRLLGTIAESLQSLGGSLGHVGRTTHPSPELIPQQFAPEELVGAEREVRL